MEDPVDIDSLVAELRRRVEARRREGRYPPGLEEQLAVQFERIFDAPDQLARAWADLDRLRAARPHDAATDLVVEVLQSTLEAIDELAARYVTGVTPVEILERLAALEAAEAQRDQ